MFQKDKFRTPYFGTGGRNSISRGALKFCKKNGFEKKHLFLSSSLVGVGRNCILTGVLKVGIQKVSKVKKTNVGCTNDQKNDTLDRWIDETT